MIYEKRLVAQRQVYKVLKNESLEEKGANRIIITSI